MNDVSHWLNSLGLDRYASLFREHEIDADSLCELTDSDLRELAIPLGHRKRILKGINQLRDSSTSSQRDPRASLKTDAQPSRDAERRHLTILFVDMVESTAFAQRLDPEDLVVVQQHRTPHGSDGALRHIPA